MRQYEYWEKLLLGEFNISERDNNIYDRVERYYKETKDLDNKQAMVYLKELKTWCMDNCYSSAELKKTKRLVEQNTNDSRDC